MPACKVQGKCINQLFRPKTYIPVMIRGLSMGDCTTCQPCAKNLECTGYYPAPGLGTVGKHDDDDNKSDGSVDDNSGVHDGPSGDSTDN